MQHLYTSRCIYTLVFTKLKAMATWDGVLVVRIYISLLLQCLLAFENQHLKSLLIAGLERQTKYGPSDRFVTFIY